MKNSFLGMLILVCFSSQIIQNLEHKQLFEKWKESEYRFRYPFNELDKKWEEEGENAQLSDELVAAVGKEFSPKWVWKAKLFSGKKVARAVLRCLNEDQLNNPKLYFPLIWRTLWEPERGIYENVLDKETFNEKRTNYKKDICFLHKIIPSMTREIHADILQRLNHYRNQLKVNQLTANLAETKANLADERAEAAVQLEARRLFRESNELALSVKTREKREALIKARDAEEAQQRAEQDVRVANGEKSNAQAQVRFQNVVHLKDQVRAQNQLQVAQGQKDNAQAQVRFQNVVHLKDQVRGQNQLQEVQKQRDNAQAHVRFQNMVHFKSLAAMSKETSKKVSDLENEITRLNGLLEDIWKKLPKDDNDGQKEQLLRQIEQLQTNLLNKQAEITFLQYESRLKNLQLFSNQLTENNNLRQERNDAQRQLSVAKSGVADLQGKNLELDTRLTSLMEGQNNALETLKKMSSHNSELQNTITNLNQIKDSIEQKMQKAFEDGNAVIRARDTATESLESLNIEVQQLREQIRALEAKDNNNNNSIAGQLQQARMELGAKQAKINQLENEISTKDGTIAIHVKQAEEAKKNLEHAQVQYTKLSDLKKKAELKLEETQERIELLQESMESSIGLLYEENPDIKKSKTKDLVLKMIEKGYTVEEVAKLAGLNGKDLTNYLDLNNNNNQDTFATLGNSRRVKK